MLAISTAYNLKRSRIAIKAIFFLNGFVHANYFSRLPRVQDSFHIDNGTTGLVLLTLSLGAFLAMPFTGWLIIRNGSRIITLVALYVYCLLVPLIPVVAPDFNLLLLIFFMLGVASGTLDVAMNAQAVIIEQRWGKPIMTSFHAFFSIGMMFGALAGSLFTKLELGLLMHFGTIAIFCVCIILSLQFFLIHDKPDGQPHEGPAFRLPTAAMVGIGVIAFCSMLGEGAMDGWTTIYMENIALSSKVTAPLGLFSFALAMTIGRIFGDRARLKFGDRKLMIWCGLISAAGLLLTIAITHPYIVIAGFFVIGLGLATVVPIAYSIAGSTKELPPGVGIAMVTTIGYSGFMVGPPVIGFLADSFTLRYALLLVVALFLVMTILATRYRPK